MNKEDFDSLTESVYNKLNNNRFKTTVNKRAYDLKNAKTFLEKITTQKISENEASRLYFDLIISEIIKLQKLKGSRGKNRKKNILGVLEKLGSIFTDPYLYYYSTSESRSESKIEQSEENIEE